MKKYAFCVPHPGLHRATDVYAMCVGIINTRVLVDPTIYNKPGEQALVAHEMCHAAERHGLKYLISIVVGSAITTAVALSLALNHPGFWVTMLLGFPVGFWWTLHLFFLRECEIEADLRALEETDAKQFISFLYLHPHPKGRWGRWKYGSSIEARVRRILPS